MASTDRYGHVFTKSATHNTWNGRFQPALGIFCKICSRLSFCGSACTGFYQNARKQSHVYKICSQVLFMALSSKLTGYSRPLILCLLNNLYLLLLINDYTPKTTHKTKFLVPLRDDQTVASSWLNTLQVEQTLCR